MANYKDDAAQKRYEENLGKMGVSVHTEAGRRGLEIHKKLFELPKPNYWKSNPLPYVSPYPSPLPDVAKLPEWEPLYSYGKHNYQPGPYKSEPCPSYGAEIAFVLIAIAAILVWSGVYVVANSFLLWLGIGASLASNIAIAAFPVLSVIIFAVAAGCYFHVEMRKPIAKAAVHVAIFVLLNAGAFYGAHEVLHIDVLAQPPKVFGFVALAVLAVQLVDALKGYLLARSGAAGKAALKRPAGKRK